MELLEREDDVAALDRAANPAARAHGGTVVLVSGEAGIGKSALVRRFAERVPGRVAWGWSDALETPTPLAAVRDVAAALGLDDDLVETADAARMSRALAEALAGAGAPRAVVLEDLHWADAATLDVVRSLARRVAQLRTALVLTFRDEPPTPELRGLLGDLAGMPGVVRIRLAPLSVEAVGVLAAGTDFDAGRLHERTAGNPFFVTEVVAAGEELPRTVRDAVLARVGRLGPAARNVVEIVAVGGIRLERGLVATAAGAEFPAADEAVAAGVLSAEDDALGFRHELARRAVRSDIPPARLASIHRRLLDALRAAPARHDLARLVAHAIGADDHAAVLELAPLAAAEAAAAGSHREAAAHLRAALAVAGGEPDDRRAELLEAYAREADTIDDPTAAEAAIADAVALRRGRGEDLRLVDDLVRLAAIAFSLGRTTEADAASREAVELAERHPPGRELAAAYRRRAALRMLTRDTDEAIEWGDRALALARTIGDDALLAGALNATGSARIVRSEFEAGVADLRESLDVARRAGLDYDACAAFTNLGSASGEIGQYRFADAVLTEGMAEAGTADVDVFHHYMQAWRALTRLHLGDAAGAAEDAHAVLGRDGTAAISRIMALLALGRLRARRGDPGADEALDDALALAESSDTLQRIAPVRAARAEAAWLAGDDDRAAAEAEAALPLAVAKRHPVFAAELTWWLRAAGREPAVPEWADGPYAAMAAGDWAAAARGWAERGAVFEEQLARGFAEAPEAIEAVRALEAMGAPPAAEALRRRLRAAGVGNLPRGPRASTRDDPFGLTRRESEVLALVADGASNQAIAERLSLSVRTVDHHVSAILGKLGVATRGAAAALARRAESETP
ncbi:AAA family ATPase [Agromyces tropicus]|uniref:AAA family ATPase n=1 Tax=Agromyces tropicus TaxID=555371 RepID=A0ABP5FL92_9MICO